MREKSHARSFALAGITLAVLGGMSSASAQIGPEGLPSVEHVDRGARPERPRMSSRFAVVSRDVVAPPRAARDVQRHQRAQRESTVPGKPLLTGSTRELAARDRELLGAQLDWHPIPGGHAAMVKFNADGAKGLRLRLKLEGPAHGVKLRFAGSADPDDVVEVDGARMVGQPQYWSPAVEGDSMRVEIVAEEGIDRASVRLSNLALMHIDQMVVNPTAGGLGTANLACHRDIACRPDQSEAYKAATRSAIGLSFVVNGNNFWCTGTLVNSATSPRQAYAITANHCIDNQAVANSVYTVFFMDATGCGSGERGPDYFVLREGAQLLYNSQPNDHALIRLNGRLPNGVHYAGWSPAGVGVGAPVLGIHHPAGDLKKYSEGSKSADNSRLNGYAGTFHQVQWNVGAVEGGSSGSGLFQFNPSNNSYQIVGQLLGYIPASTGAPPTCSSPALYGRFQDVYAAGRGWLDPSNPLSILNAASYQSLELAPAALVAAWGPGLPQQIVQRIPSDRANASDPRCTYTLGGRYSINVRSLASGQSNEACVLFVGAGQVNFMLPPQMQPGERVDVEVVDSLAQTVIAKAPNAPVASFAPGIFTTTSDGKGTPSGNIVRVKNGQQTYENVPSDPNQPIDLGGADEEVFLILYGTGLRGKPGTTTASATIGGIAAPIEYLGDQMSYLGLDQVNLKIPKAGLRQAGVKGKALVELRFTDQNGVQSVPNRVEIYVR